jgi:hypothetical protein
MKSECISNGRKSLLPPCPSKKVVTKIYKSASQMSRIILDLIIELPQLFYYVDALYKLKYTHLTPTPKKRINI